MQWVRQERPERTRALAYQMSDLQLHERLTLGSKPIERTQYLGKTVYIKRFDETMAPKANAGRPAQNRCTREIDIINRLVEITGLGGQLGQVALVDGRPEDGLLVTEEVPGLPLSEHVRGWRQDPSRLCEAMDLAGRWIRLFQGLSKQTGDTRRLGRISPIDLVEYCDIRIRGIQDHGYRWATPARRRRILEVLRDLTERSQDEALVWSHGDYAPNNMIWDGQVLTPIDFAMANLDRPLKDVSYFIHRLEMMPVYVPWRRWPTSRWTQAFLNGYGRPDAQRSPIYHALAIRHLLCRLQTYVERPPRNARQRAHNVWVRHQVRRRLLEQVVHAAV